MIVCYRSFPRAAGSGSPSAPSWPLLTALIFLHVFASLASLVYVAELYGYIGFLRFDEGRLPGAAMIVVPFSIISALFVFSRFSFGYFLGFYFYTMVLGYIWLASFAESFSDNALALASATTSIIAFLVPALFITRPLKPFVALTDQALDFLLGAILAVSAITIAVGALYNFRLVGIDAIYQFRGQLEFPVVLRYGIGIASNSLLPFAYASYLSRRSPLGAAATLLLLLAFYPITLTKSTLFAPIWLLLLTLLTASFTSRASVILSLLLPTSFGLLLVLIFKSGIVPYGVFITYFSMINFRMVAFPSIAFEVYNHFFSAHDLTRFCQIQFLKPLVSCPYGEPLSVLMEKNYQLGNLNASLFATEGVASVGTKFAPITALACGFAIAVANRISSRLPARFIVLSSGLVVPVFVNVPFTTTLLSNGAAVLFLLWYIMPRCTPHQHQNSPIQQANAGRSLLRGKGDASSTIALRYALKWPIRSRRITGGVASPIAHRKGPESSHGFC